MRRAAVLLCDDASLVAEVALVVECLVGGGHRGLSIGVWKYSTSGNLGSTGFQDVLSSSDDDIDNIDRRCGK
jgi:hypothetical protein